MAARNSGHWALSLQPSMISGTWTTRLYGASGMPAGKSLPIPVAQCVSAEWDPVVQLLRDLCLSAPLTHPPLRKKAGHLGSMHAGMYTYNVRSRTGVMVNLAALRNPKACRTASAKRCAGAAGKKMAA